MIDNVLKVNQSSHELLINHAKKLYSEEKYTELINFIEELALVEKENYIGILTSPSLEILLKKVASKKISSPLPLTSHENKKRKVLHVGTEFYSVGGHTKVVLDWISNDTNSDAEILVTNQKKELSLGVSAPIHYVPAKLPSLEKAKYIRELLSTNFYDIIVIHQHHHDVVPTLAFWDIQKYNTKVLFYNHANFKFSIGNIIASQRVNLSKGDVKISSKYRFPINDVFLPFVLGENLPVVNNNDSDVLELKNTLKIGDEKVFLTIASAYKYKPNESQNFFKEWNSFLQKHKNIVLVVIGVTVEDVQLFTSSQEIPENIKLCGVVKNPVSYYKLADYVIESYPIVSGLSVFEPMYYGALPIVSYDNVTIIGEHVWDAYSDGTREKLNYQNKEEYFEFIGKEIANSSYKNEMTNELKEFIEDNHLKSGWSTKLEDIYSLPIVEKNIDSYKFEEIMNNSRASLRWYDYQPKDYALYKHLLKRDVFFSFKVITLFFRVFFSRQKTLTSKTVMIKLFLKYLWKKIK